MDRSGHPRQNYFPTLMSLAVPLRVPQGTEAGTGHILHFAHVNDDFMYSTPVRGFESFRQTDSFHAVYSTPDCEQLNVLDLLRRNFHGSFSSSVMSMSCLRLNTIKVNVTTTWIGSERFGFGWRVPPEIILSIKISRIGGMYMERALKITSFFLFPVAVYVLHVAVKAMGVYQIFPHTDIPFHYVGGLSIAYTCSQVLLYLESEKITTTLHRGLFLLFLLSITATATVFWEFAEFLSDQILQTNLQPSIANTMQDQFLGILGGGTWAFIHFKQDST
jgi:hypothetical protein